MKKILSFIKNSRNSTVAKNFVSLSLLQVANYVFPLITLPYITRIFGPELYGLINFATSFIAYFTLIVNYGFDLSASRDIAQNRDNWANIEKIFNNVLFSKVLLFLVSALVFFITLFSVAKINQYKILYLIMFLGVGGNVFFPTWFFQGIEKLNLTAIFTFIIRLIFTLLVFLLIKSKNDYLLYPVTTLIGQIIVSIISLWLIQKTYKIKIKLPLLTDIWKTLKNDAKIFYTTVVINLYTTTNFVMLGFLAGDYDVGIYSAAYKIVIIIMSIISGPLSQSLYPSIGKTFAKSRELGIIKVYKALIFVIPLTLIPSVVIFLFPDLIIHALYGHKFDSAIETLKLLAFAPLIIGLSNVFGIQGLLNLKLDGFVTIVTTIGAIMGLTLNFIFVPIYKYNGTAISWLITEITITILMIIAFAKNTDFIFNLKKYS